MLELDSHAKVQMRGKIRGLRGIERELLKARAAERTGAEKVTLAVWSHHVPTVGDGYVFSHAICFGFQRFPFSSGIEEWSPGSEWCNESW